MTTETLPQERETIERLTAALGELPLRAALVPAGDFDDDDSESHIWRGID
ncbi:hypothetical protein ACFVQ4_27235 [Streptomyces laurentii]